MYSDYPSENPHYDAEMLAAQESGLVRRPEFITKETSMAVQQISGKLDTKALAKYLKKSRKVKTIRVYRHENGYLWVTDGLLLVRTFLGSGLTEFTPPEPGLWQYDQDSTDEQPHLISSPDVLKFWESSCTDEVVGRLKVTHLLHEEAHYKRPSTLFRKLLCEDSTVWCDRVFLDCFATDPADLNSDFILELVQKAQVPPRHSRMIRVSCCYGITAFLMPAQNIPNE